MTLDTYGSLYKGDLDEVARRMGAGVCVPGACRRRPKRGLTSVPARFRIPSLARIVACSVADPVGAR